MSGDTATASNPILTGLNPAQNLAVSTTEGPLAVIAGAGSGKTLVVTKRIAYIIYEGLAAPEEILAVTFTNKAAKEMSERVEELVGETLAGGIWMGTFHSICSRILRQYGDVGDIPTNFTIFDQDDQTTLIKAILQDMDIDRSQVTPGYVRSRISRYKNDVIGPQKVKVTNPLDELVVMIYTEYQKRLRAMNALDFGDLIILAIRLLKDFPDLREGLSDRFRYILVDEFQDTNIAQYDLITLLTNEDMNICVVGDPDQSIYGWRGACIDNIEKFLSMSPPPKLLSLERNYRSTQKILDIANSLIKYNNTRGTDKNLYSEGEGGGVVPTIYEATDEKDEAEYVAEKILEKRYSDGYSLCDIAVLYRTHAQSRQLEQALRKKNIPYIIVGGTRFYERMEVKDILAYLRLVINEEDDISFIRAVTNPRRGIGKGTLARIEEFSRRKSISLLKATKSEELLDSLTSHRKGILTEFTKLIDDLSDMVEERTSIVEVVTTVMNRSGYLEKLEEKGTIEAETRVENLMELINAVSEFEDEYKEDEDIFQSFLESVSLITNIDNWDRDSDAVSLMTLHSAKGLEFPFIFITGLEEGLLPHYNSMDSLEEIEEERRLMYVGITRAQEILYITCSNYRMSAGEGRITTPSRFLDELSDGEVIMDSYLNRERDYYDY